MTSASALEHRSRYELVEEARSLGVERPERMTMQELKDEILRLTLSEEEQVGARGLFGVARAMLASVVEAGLKMPDAAKVIRGDVTLDLPVRSRSPVATVTLAEIYAAQGHRARALAVLDEVLAIEPDHEEAQRIRRELTSPDTSTDAASARAAATSPQPEEPSPLRRSGPPSEIEAPAARPATGEVEPSGEFPSTEYVPIEVVETTGHEVALTPPPGPVSARPVDSPAESASDAMGVPSEPPPGVNLWLEPPPAPLESTAEPAEAPPAVDLWQSPPPPLESTELVSTPSYEAPVSPVTPAAAPVLSPTEPLLATEQRGATLCLYWELPPEVVARSGLTESEGEPAVAVVAFTPSGPQPLRDQRTLPLDWRVPFAGCLVVPGLGPSAAVRAAVGWVVEGTFLPLAVGRTLERLAVDAPAVAARAREALDQLDV